MSSTVNVAFLLLPVIRFLGQQCSFDHVSSRHVVNSWVWSLDLPETSCPLLLLSQFLSPPCPTLLERPAVEWRCRWPSTNGAGRWSHVLGPEVGGSSRRSLGGEVEAAAGVGVRRSLAGARFWPDAADVAADVRTLCHRRPLRLRLEVRHGASPSDVQRRVSPCRPDASPLSHPTAGVATKRWPHRPQFRWRREWGRRTRMETAATPDGAALGGSSAVADVMLDSSACVRSRQPSEAGARSRPPQGSRA